MLRAAEELIAAGDEDPKTIAAKLGPIVEAPDADPLLFQFWIDDDGIQSHIRAKLSDFKLKQQQKEERERQQRSTEAAKKCLELEATDPEAARALADKYRAEFGGMAWHMALVEAGAYDHLEDEEEKPAPTAKKRKGVFKQARRVSRAPETWRVLKNYPTYEVSSHGRVRSLDRARPDDWLKPRYRWYKGMGTSSVVIKDRDGTRCERDIAKLMIDAGFLSRPTWMKHSKSL